MMRISIGVPIHNEIGFLSKLFDQLYEVQEGFSPNIEVILIDNFSTDGSREYLANLNKNKKFKDFRIILNERNMGFNHSCDVLMASAKNDYLWIIGAQDTIYPDGVSTLLKLLNNNEPEYVYLVCNARVRDEITGKIINESLWGDTNSADFSSLESFFKLLGGPCQAVSCNIFKTNLIRKALNTQVQSHYWGYYERICDMLINSGNNFKVGFISKPLIEILIEADNVAFTDISLFGSVPRAEYGPFYTSLELAEIANRKFHSNSIRKNFTVFRDPFAIPRSLAIAKSKGIRLSAKLILRLIDAYKNSISFWLLGIPLILLPRQFNKQIVKFKPVVHFFRNILFIREF